VEFTVFTDVDGRTKAENVTGPMGVHVQGAPMRRTMDYERFDDFENNKRY
jgi:predicted lipoprotein